MNKFEKMALVGRFTNRNQGLTIQELEALVEIIAATPNETVAVELLLGIYENVRIHTTPLKPLRYDNRALPVFLSFNKFTNRVTYGYNKQPIKTCWVLKNEADPTFSDITEEMTDYESTQMHRLGIKTQDEFRSLYRRTVVAGPIDLAAKHEDTCDLSDWQ